MAPKRAPAEVSSTANKGKRLEVAKMTGSKRKRLDKAQRNANKGKRVVIDENVEARKKATFNRATFITLELAQRFNLHFHNRTIIPGRNIDFSKLSYFQFDRLFMRMGWLPIVSLKEFLYPRRLCGYKKFGRPTSHSLTVLSRILQYMISYIFIPKRGHRDDVSFLEVFLVDSILTERKINMGYIIFRHMKASSLSEDSVLPYGMFITKIIKYFNVNLRNKTDRKKLKSFDTCDWVSLRCMHFSYVPPSEVDVSSDDESSQDEEYENQDVEGRGFENANVTTIPSNDGVGAIVVADHPSQIGRNDAEASDNLNAQIYSLGTHLEEMVLANERRFTCLEDRIDGF
ncbi:hypothetical protein PVL29_013682 [Vitis rotundifolia]|uniref:Uncharacterized protein n=1 Tax=Vitis rotundifolia TaxID=103349 RepID=A0AA39DQ26_VITRO|nr:hypothetical protein PVL29_013682 [Vitis rotundifolia]